MKRRLSLAALALLAACEAGTEQEAVDYRPGTAGTVDHALCLLGFTAVPLGELATGHHIVEGRLNGRPATFVLDTGANATVLDVDHTDAFGLEPGRISGGAVGLGGSMSASAAAVESLSIGPVPVRQERIMVTDLSQLSSLLEPLAGQTIHGIVGQDLMNEHRAVIDVARPILYLIEADEEPAPVPAERCQTGAEGGAGRD